MELGIDNTALGLGALGTPIIVLIVDVYMFLVYEVGTSITRLDGKPVEGIFLTDSRLRP